MNLPILQPRPDCRDCTFGEGARCAGIAGRPLRVVGSDRAILCVGQSPGVNEDEAGEIFIGESGAILEGPYLSCLPESVDVWVTNAVKCIPPYKTDPKAAQIKPCNRWLLDDVEQLLRSYSEVAILCLGTVATRAVIDCGVEETFGRQGRSAIELPWATSTEKLSKAGKLSRKYGGVPLSKPVKVFATYHPAWLLRDPRPGNRAAIKDHLALVARHFRETATTEKSEVRDVGLSEFLSAVAEMPDPEIWLDLETYGIREGVVQTQFTPRSCAAVDGVPTGRQIESVALSVDRGGDVLAFSGLWTPKVRAGVWELLRRIEERGWRLSATNVLFDSGILIGEFPSWFPERTRLRDLLIRSFLQNPDRPENGLKDLSALLLEDGLLEKYGPKGQKYPRTPAGDHDLLTYNRKDVVNPVFLSRELKARIRENGLPRDLEKTEEYYGITLRVLLHMTLHGCAIDRKKLEVFSGKLLRRMGRLEALMMKLWEYPLSGPGSGKAESALFRDIVERVPNGPAGGWELTEKKGLISTNEANLRRALVADLPREIKRKVRALWKFRQCRKIESSYLSGLLRLTERTNVVYPSWFPIPSKFDAEQTDSFRGGSRQGRATCKRPALQTSPSKVKKLFTTRFRGGALWAYDYAALEMRDAALVSGDEALTEIFRTGGDPHQTTLEESLRRKVRKDEPNYDRMRRSAKFTNFGTLYGGEARAIQGVLWKDAGQWESEDTLWKFIHGFNRKFAGYVRWRSGLIPTVKDQGFLELPITGHWLSFSVYGKLDKAIYNFPIQGVAALQCLFAQEEVRKWLKETRYGVMPLNIYDSLLIDWKDARVAEREEETVKGLMVDNWYMRALAEHYGRKIPFKVDAKRLA